MQSECHNNSQSPRPPDNPTESTPQEFELQYHTCDRIVRGEEFKAKFMIGLEQANPDTLLVALVVHCSKNGPSDPRHQQYRVRNRGDIVVFIALTVPSPRVLGLPHHLSRHLFFLFLVFTCWLLYDTVFRQSKLTVTFFCSIFVTTSTRFSTDRKGRSGSHENHGIGN